MSQQTDEIWDTLFAMADWAYEKSLSVRDRISFDGVIDIGFGEIIRTSNEEFRTSEWKEVGRMEQGMCDPVDQRREHCAKEEAHKERQVGAEYMKQRHGLIESREPAYRPVKSSGGKRKGKY